jgi:hypothetical protein
VVVVGPREVFGVGYKGGILVVNGHWVISSMLVGSGYLFHTYGPGLIHVEHALSGYMHEVTWYFYMYMSWKRGFDEKPILDLSKSGLCHYQFVGCVVLQSDD